jgi:hypothetical protein
MLFSLSAAGSLGFILPMVALMKWESENYISKWGKYEPLLGGLHA